MFQYKQDSAITQSQQRPTTNKYMESLSLERNTYPYCLFHIYVVSLPGCTCLSYSQAFPLFYSCFPLTAALLPLSQPLFTFSQVAFAGISVWILFKHLQNYLHHYLWTSNNLCSFLGDLVEWGNKLDRCDAWLCFNYIIQIPFYIALPSPLLLVHFSKFCTVCPTALCI